MRDKGNVYLVLGQLEDNYAVSSVDEIHLVAIYSKRSLNNVR
ncbi:hypothetical protein Back11_39520 [Paenibacillus baekrokdamisoli]|uniref:Uncharacterized protein n=1 Tax=Paenibacillus baekrokdamisoli TaxID=1712516 RepID=A0A3G9IUX0_9BACL|nr:hypothetical protein [Paenibacillus baekrokdamisoli]MBB3068351.1 hypothetical protein [Paenibacillus baekrokdamisoli]BBH22607.1 hypothetical protein Back11_39520 [Paenibacillus baekrokdamisoli]